MRRAHEYIKTGKGSIQEESRVQGQYTITCALIVIILLEFNQFNGDTLSYTSFLLKATK